MLGPEDQPEAVVERMLAAFNRHDVDGVIATYSPDIEFFVLGGERWAPGLEAWRKQNESMFESAPGLHCEVPDRLVQGHYVIAHAPLTSDADDQALAPHIIYHVRRTHVRPSWSVPVFGGNPRRG